LRLSRLAVEDMKNLIETLAKNPEPLEEFSRVALEPRDRYYQLSLLISLKPEKLRRLKTRHYLA